LTAAGEALSWSATARHNHYVLRIKVPGAGLSYEMLDGTRATPAAHLGLTVGYQVRARAWLSWSNEVWITYPLRAAEAGRQASEDARAETKEAVEREAREATQREATARKREKTEHEGKAEREAREKAEREAKERAEREAREKAEREAREKAEREAKERAEREAREKAEREAKERAEREAREKAEREAREREEAEHAKGVLTFTPTVIPLSAPEIPNSGRGLYDWMGEHSMTPAGWPLVDYYLRDELSWPRDLETSKGVYPFLTTPGVIDSALAKAQAKGGKLRFRVMAWMGGGSPRYPSYIPTMTSSGYTFPDWNSEGWLTAWENLWKALGQKYGSDPRVGEVDTSGYGAWGEWHMCPSSCAMTVGSHITTANGVRMVAAVVKAFPKAHVVLGTSAAIKDEAPLQPPLMPAIIKAFPTVGFHMDNFGAVAPADGNNLPYAKPGGAVANAEIWERWKTAPVIGEWWNQSNATLANAKQTEEEQHVALIGSGNNPSQIWKSNPAQYEEILKRSGFREQLDRVEVTALLAGHAAIVTSTWENVNVAPTYDPWEVRYELRSGESVAWSATSALDLRKLLPTEGKPLKATDTFTLPVGLPKGTYTLAIKVVDPTGALAPMRLADNGRTGDGAYPLGALTVG
jgi:chemotaxis protein histidine kinase CheA